MFCCCPVITVIQQEALEEEGKDTFFCSAPEVSKAKKACDPKNATKNPLNILTRYFEEVLDGRRWTAALNIIKYSCFKHR